MLHVGAGKCGSSSLQRWLTDHPLLTLRDGSTAGYWCVLPDTTLSPEQVAQRGARADVPYCHSTLARPALADFDRRLHRILDATPPGDCVLLSSEALTLQWQLGPDLSALRRADVEAEAILFVRPQVEWTASAWWQWGMWTGAPLRGWVGHAIHASDWAEQARQWQQVPGIGRVTVSETQGDVVARFLGLIGATPDPASAEMRSNSTSPRALLRFLKRQARYRNGVHASHHETLVMQLASPPGPRPVPPLTPAEIARIVNAHRPGNLQLAEEHGCFAPDDPRWFDAGQQLPAAQPQNQREEEDALIGALIDGLAALAERHGDLADENARLRLALEGRWGRLARLFLARYARQRKTSQDERHGRLLLVAGTSGRRPH